MHIYHIYTGIYNQFLIQISEQSNSMPLLAYHIYIYIYSSEYKDQNNVKKKSKCEITFYFKAS